MMKTEEKIIRVFLEDKSPRTIRELSRCIRADYRITYTATQRLLEKAVLLSTTVGKSTLCELNDQYSGSEIYTVQEQRKTSLLQKNTMKQLYKEVMSQMTSHFFIFLIFGSYAKGTQTTSSDIDLLIISNESGCEARISEILSLLPLRTHPLVFTEEEFIRMKNSRQANIVKEVLEHHIILYGVETFYRIKNA